MRIPVNALGRPIYEHETVYIHERLRRARAAAMVDDGTGVRLPGRVATAAFLSALVAMATGTTAAG